MKKILFKTVIELILKNRPIISTTKKSNKFKVYIVVTGMHV